jgi:cytochrome c
MSPSVGNERLFGLITGAVVAALSFSVLGAVDEEAAKVTARENNCFKCHSASKEKDGPAFSKIAAKYRGREDAEARLTTHLTTGEKAKFPDGHEEEHKIIKTKDSAETANIVRWILSR